MNSVGTGLAWIYEAGSSGMGYAYRYGHVNRSKNKK